MARSAFVYNGHEVVRKVDTIADVAPFSRYIMERKEVRELLGDGSFVFSESRFEYDRYGNVTRLEERANAVETITVDIRYWNNSALNLHSHPEEITVRGLQTGLLRKRIGVYNNNGTMRELTQMLNESRSSADSTSTLLWDSYGNLSSITDPNGAYVSYRYDLRFNQFVEEIITGGRGITPYRSFIDWDMALVRKIKETDMSGNSINYVYDSYGRLEEVWSPYDRFGQGGSTPAVRYEYFNPQGSNWYAITQNKIQFDSNNNDTLTTVVMTDGLGRALYTAKQGEVWNNGNTKKGWNVSGFVSYDGKGRTIEAGQPLFVDILRAEDLVNWNLRDRNLMINPTIQEYDNLDRVTKVTLPAAPTEQRPVQTTRHEIRNGNTVTIATDPLLNISEQTVDSRGNITLIRRLDNLQRELTRATYRYNPLGEMLAAFDADGNPLTVEYDRLGRRIRMTSADIGTKNWQYDPAGNLVSEWDSQLASLGRRINYTYDGLNRLTRINYPFSEDTVYEYGTSDRTDNSAGRVTKLIDETGFTTYTYGMLGQVEEERRVIKLLPLSSGLSKEAVMRYTSDYLGRMQEIIYPDGERLRYEYNYGGQIVKVTGVRQNTTFNYVNNIGYDEYSQRVYIEYGSGVKSYYSYDEHRRWLSTVRTENQNRLAYQNLSYEFDMAGNVLSYTNTSDGHTTTQTYSYDGLYQLIQAQGSSRSHPYGPGGATEYTTTYKQDFTFNRIGNMTNKLSESMVSTPNRLGDNLNYNLDYDYVQGTRKASRIGNRHYSYDLNGNLIAERDGSNAVNPEVYRPYYQDGDLYWTDYGFGVTRPQTQNSSDGVYQRNYRWNERNLLSESSDSAFTVQYRYGADGQRAIKYVLNNRKTTLYFNRMWQTNDSRAEWVQSKHIYLGEQRILTKYNSEGNNNTQ
ncbi:MAG: hypothetical protein FWD47_13665, partial [Treponema sp.]|nr:hypothetical protein [Treponema sp.]